VLYEGNNLVVRGERRGDEGTFVAGGAEIGRTCLSREHTAHLGRRVRCPHDARSPDSPLMSVGIFLGVRAGFPEEEADRYMATIRDVLGAAGLPEYTDTLDPAGATKRYEKLHRGARSPRDTLGTSMRPLARRVVRAKGAAAGAFHDFVSMTDKVFVPGDFTQRLEAPSLPGGCLWSTGALREALRVAALTLGLPLSKGEVPEPVLAKIRAERKLGPHDASADDVDQHGFSDRCDYRTSWLALWEFTRIAHENQIALALSS
jgi:hypothetical protein